MSNLETLDYANGQGSGARTAASLVGFGCGGVLLLLIGVGMGVGIGWSTRNVAVYAARQEVAEMSAEVELTLVDLKRSDRRRRRMGDNIRLYKKKNQTIERELKKTRTLTAEVQRQFAESDQMAHDIEQDLAKEADSQRARAQELQKASDALRIQLNDRDNELAEEKLTVKQLRGQKWSALITKMQLDLCSRNREKRKIQCEHAVRRAAYNTEIEWRNGQPDHATETLSDEFDYCLDLDLLVDQPSLETPCTDGSDRALSLTIDGENPGDWCISLCTTDLPEDAERR